MFARHRLSLRVLLVSCLLLALAAGFMLATQHTKTRAAASGSFVTVSSSGTQLMLNGQPFRFSGPNIYWLGTGVDQPGVDYNTQVDNILQIVSQPSPNGMDETVVRAHTLGISAGCGNDSCIEPSLGNIPDPSPAFNKIDYAISRAAYYHLHLIIPLVDNWDYGDGSKHTFASWRGDSNDDDFYSDPNVVSDFKYYIQAVLNHVNSITGVAYKNDPTIIAWEEGNELNDAPSSWVEDIASYIKSIDSNHLVAFGTQSGIQTDTLSLPDVDIEDAHYYPMDTNRLINDAKAVYQAGKVFYAGEYGWDTGDLTSWLSAIEANDPNQGYLVSGDDYWSLFPKGVPHNDGYTLHFPGDDDAMNQSIAQLTAHAQVMSAGSNPGTGGGGSNAPVGKTIWLKANSNGDYVSAWLNDPNTPLEARSTQVQAWEEFDVVDAGNGNIALKAHANGNYVSAWQSDTNTPLDARSNHLQAWETFRWLDQGNGTVALQSVGNGSYVSAWISDPNTPLEARSNHIQGWETFQWGQV